MLSSCRHSVGVAISFVTLVIALTACDAGTDRNAPVAQLNVILISVDSLRADHLGLYGYPKPTSPFLDALANDSAVFERAYAPSSYTLQSVAALLTGRLPTSGGSVGLLEAQPAETAATLGRLFRGAGARTGIISNQPLLRPRGFTRGFEDIQITGMESDWSAADVTGRALRFIDDNEAQPFFLYAHYLEPHQPYDAPAEFIARFDASPADASVSALTDEIDAGQSIAPGDSRVEALIARYDAEIAYVDHAIEQLVSGLRQRGLSANSVIIVTGSQGEEFLEHGYLGHAWTLNEEVLRVPLLIHAPGLIEAQRVANAVSTVDLYPTLVELFGLDVGDWQPDGASFIRTAAGKVTIQPPQAAKLAELVIRERCIMRAVIQDDWKYVANYIPCDIENRDEITAAYPELVASISSGTVEAPPLWGEIRHEALFNLADDPAERANLAATEPARLARLRSLLEGYQAYCEINALKATEAVAPEVTDPNAAERLKSLGYL